MQRANVDNNVSQGDGNLPVDYRLGVYGPEMPSHVGRTKRSRIKVGWTINCTTTLQTMKTLPEYNTWCCNDAILSKGCYYFMNCEQFVSGLVSGWFLVSVFSQSFGLSFRKIRFGVVPTNILVQEFIRICGELSSPLTITFIVLCIVTYQLKWGRPR